MERINKQITNRIIKKYNVKMMRTRVNILLDDGILYYDKHNTFKLLPAEKRSIKKIIDVMYERWIALGKRKYIIPRGTLGDLSGVKWQTLTATILKLHPVFISIQTQFQNLKVIRNITPTNTMIFLFQRIHNESRTDQPK